MTRSTHSGEKTNRRPILCINAHFCPFPAGQQGTLHLRLYYFGASISNYAEKKALEALMDYAHANFQSFPLSHHKVTRLRNQYCSVNSMDLTWAFFLPSALSFYSTVSASWLMLCPRAERAGFMRLATKCQILMELVLTQPPIKAWFRYLVYPRRYAPSKM